MTKQYPFSGQQFMTWLEAQGIPLSAMTYRVVIDAQVNEPVRITISEYGPASLLDTTAPPELSTAVITREVPPL